MSVRLAAMGYHCEKLTRQQTILREFKSYLKSELASFNEAGRGSGAAGVADKFIREALQRARVRQRAIPEEFRHAGDGISESMAAFEVAIRRQTGANGEAPGWQGATETRPASPVNGNLPVAGRIAP